MAEIRLICPDCGTVYQVPEAAIPAGGREVECSECGTSWRATNPALAVAAPMPDAVPAVPAAPAPHAPTAEAVDSAPPAPSPKTAPLDQRLPPNVLNILREAVETERRARHGTDHPQSGGLPDIDWPATTITDTEAERRAIPAAPLAPISPPAPPHPPMPEPVTRQSQPAEVAEPVPAPPAAPTTAKAQPARNGGYLIGMGLSAMLAAALVTAYVMAPRMADAGELGAMLMDLRQQIDGVRVWLDGMVR